MTFMIAGIACLVASALGTALKAAAVKIPLLSRAIVRAVLGAAGVLLLLASQLLRHPVNPIDAREEGLRAELREVEAQAREIESLQQRHRGDLATLEAMTAERQRDLDSGRADPDGREHMSAEIEKATSAISAARSQQVHLDELLRTMRTRRQELQLRLDAR